MPKSNGRYVGASNTKRQSWKGALFVSSAFAAMSMFSVASAQDGASDDDGELTQDVVTVTGIRSSLESALNQKRSADSLIEVIQAQDIGKLPDQNLAEVLENITGIQITRTAGVGTNVQIRGTDDNRTEINGVSTLSSGSGRSGIDFEDVNASIISSVEVTKVPEARTIEGSVGGTINLKTIRPLELDGLLASARVQGEVNNLSTEGVQPRFSGALGNRWDTGFGDIGFVVSGSYTQQEAVSFRPRADRDNLTTVPGSNPDTFLGIQFLLQEQENDDFETINIASTLQWAPNDEFTFHIDAILNEQERSRDQYRLQASGVSALIGVAVPTSFETVDFGIGTDLGNGPGVIPAALTGSLNVNLAVDDNDPNLRFTTETGSRVTTNQVYTLGGEWHRDRWTVYAEVSNSRSDTENPTLNTTLNFLNPNAPIGSANDNAVPFIFDLSDGLAFGIDFNDPFAPTPEQLTDPNNVVLDAIQFGANQTRNSETAFRFDISHDFSEYEALGDFLTSVDIGYRYNDTSSRFADIDDSFGFSALEDSPNGSLFSQLLIEGPDNFDAADGRDLFISNFLLIDPDISFSDPDLVLGVLEEALAANRLLNPTADGALGITPEFDENAFFDVGEQTNAFYAQANFEAGIFRGNLGFRYINTQVDSVAFGPEDANGVRSLVSTPGSYDFTLPRFNLIATPTENFVVRFGYSEDVLRPSFSNLNTGFTFDTSENAAVSLGNPSLQPETVDSLDLSFEWYFAPASVISIGFFDKDRTNLFVTNFEGAALLDGPTATGFVTPGQGFVRETDPTCPGGGVFNPDVIPNVLGDPGQLGLCVDFSQPANDPAVTTQRGIEFAFQGDLSGFEDRLGWASGFGVIANYTYQEFSGGSNVDTASGRGEQVLGEGASIPEGLLDFSSNAFNITGFYEKYGLTARARYTWRDEFRTNDFGGGANTSGSSTFGFPVVTEARGQLNASISYDVTERLTVGAEGVNLTSSNIIQRCVTGDGPVCFVGFPDRRITFGATYTF